jgi:hypothetical protein
MNVSEFKTQFSRKQALNWVYKFGHRSLMGVKFSQDLQDHPIYEFCKYATATRIGERF